MAHFLETSSVPDFRTMIDERTTLPLTGIEVIDDQHGAMLAEILKLRQANQQGRGSALLEDIVIFLADYSQTHFAFEEFVMKGARYPGMDAHCESHRAFTRKFGDFRRRFEAATQAGEDVSQLSETMAAWLHGWLVGHITVEDSAVAEFLHQP